MNYDLNELAIRYQIIFPFNKLISTKYVNIYDEELAKEYNKSKQVKDKIDINIKKMEDVIKDLGEISKQVRKKNLEESLKKSQKSLNAKSIVIDRIDKAREFKDKETLDNYRKASKAHMESLQYFLKNPMEPSFTVVAHSMGTGKKLEITIFD